jgi:DeoR family transcriptional regulator, aga operon transcriptional repressor
MLIGERQRKIVDLVKDKRSITVGELSKRFRVSKITIRSDLKVLEAKGRLVRTHGGALILTDEKHDLPFEVKETRNREEKFLIGKAAADLINDGQTIILDSGTTTMEIARHIKDKSFSFLTVITNALNIAMEISRVPNLQVIMISGTMRKTLYSFVGPLAEDVLNQFNADCLFLAVDGVDIRNGMSTPDILEARYKKKMIDVSKRVILVADSSKFGKRNLSFIAPIEKADIFITDSKIRNSDLEELKNRGVEMIIV